MRCIHTVFTTGATQRYALSFPVVTVSDMVRAQFLLLDNLGIQALYASVGSSMGGMQSLAAAAMYPSRVKRAVRWVALHTLLLGVLGCTSWRMYLSVFLV